MKIYNTLTKQKETFVPIRENEISMYVCGMTIYDYCHLGHAKMMISFDMISRYFRFRGYKLNYVQNITDIDDKIIKRANENKEAYDALTERFIEAMREDQKALGILPSDQSPRATDYIDGMIKMIKALVDTGFAYVGATGDVMYRVRAFKGYGKLSNRNLDDLEVGSRIEVDESKDDPLDFVLWKMAKPDEPFWPSPWGKGRPGWHIECSVMSTCCLAETIDIHGGGMDLMFPHHENEIAQTEATTKKTFANYWMHSGFLNINNEKMSKSLGNFFLIRDALEHFSAEQIRYFMLASHYRAPVNYSEETLKSAQDCLVRFYTALRGVKIGEPIKKSEFEKRFIEAMDDDFNTPVALAVLFDLAREINKLKLTNDSSVEAHAGLLKKLAGVLGLLEQDPEDFFTDASDLAINENEIQTLINARLDARKNRDWAEADRIRDVLMEKNILLEDADGKTIWKIKH
jgi:cysteinyl-tRNA synthetase